MRINRILDRPTGTRAGVFLAGLGVLHVAFGVIRYSGTLSEMISEGLWNTTGDDPERGLAAWFIYSGLGFFFLGLLVHELVRRSTPVPTRLGWALIVWAGVGVLITPLSGFWLLAIPAAMIVRSGGSPRVESVTG